MKQLIWLLVLPVLALSQSAQDIAQKAQSRFRSFHSYEADFEQSYYSATVSTPLKEKGKLYIKKPDLMKWQYKDPEEKIFLYKDGSFQFYIPEDNQLIRSTAQDNTQESEILALLSGQKDLLHNYSVEFSPFPTKNPKVYQLKLTPKEEQTYSSILLEIYENTGLITKAVFFDWAGSKTEFHFTRIKTNPNFPADTFELQIPPGVEIIEDIKK